MPAKHLYRVWEKGIYSHIFNKGVESRTIFNDEEDYQVFISYLKEYLSPPAHPEHIKTTFTVKGRTYSGTPRQPKNYFDKIELIAYSLMPDHFHLLLHQTSHGTIESFIRSLCTRYSMYFNKKHNRTGALFQGPYKSVQISDAAQLLHLTQYIHHSTQDDKKLANHYSSQAEYLGKLKTPWVKTKIVLSIFDEEQFKKLGGYKKFVENYKSTKVEEEFLKDLILENKEDHKRGTVGAAPKPTTEPVPAIETADDGPKLRFPLWSRVPEIAGITTVLLLLVTFGVRNIKVSTAKSAQRSQVAVATPAPAVLMEADEKENVAMVTIKADVKDSIVNIRKEASAGSEKIGSARDGETFEYVSTTSGWYEVRLDENLTGFVSADFAEYEEGTN